MSTESGSTHPEKEETAGGRLGLRTGGYVLTDELRRMVEVRNDETGRDMGRDMGRDRVDTGGDQMSSGATMRGLDWPSAQPASAQLKLPEKRKGLPVKGGIVPEPKVGNKRRKTDGILRNSDGRSRARNEKAVRFQVPEEGLEPLDQVVIEDDE